MTIPLTRAALEVGLDWLYHTVQPDDAIVEHCGARISAAPGRALRFLFVANADRPVVIIEVGARRGTGYIRRTSASAAADISSIVRSPNAFRLYRSSFHAAASYASIRCARPALSSTPDTLSFLNRTPARRGCAGAPPQSITR